MSDALQTGENQLASGFFVYGPQTSLILTTGSGVASFILKQGEFIQMEWEPSIPNTGNQFAINISLIFSLEVWAYVSTLTR